MPTSKKKNMEAVSNWAAASRENIRTAAFLTERTMAFGKLSIKRSASEVWAIAELWDGQRIAFRLASTFGLAIERLEMGRPGKDHIALSLDCALGSYEIGVHFPEKKAGVFRYTLNLTPSKNLLFPYSPRDILVLGKGDAFGKAEVYLAQEGTRSGHLYFSVENSDSTVFYFQELGALSAYCEQTRTSAGASVGGSSPELGFRLPASADHALEKGKTVTLGDAFVLLSQGAPRNDVQIATFYMDHLSEIYLMLPKPATTYNDWPGLARKGLSDLKHNKGCWTQAEGKSYLNAYVSDYGTPPEIMVQLAVLVPLCEYFDWSGKKDKILNELREGLDSFFDEKLKTLARWLPSLRDRLDESEEQKKEDVMDSWYLHHPLMNLSRMALWGDKEAKELLLKSVDYAIKVAHHFKYEWPVFYEMDTLDVIKRDKGEKDVPGAYANLMLQMRDLTGEEKYLQEAIKAADKLVCNGLSIFYQANNTSFAAATLLRLYKETGRQKYLGTAYVCLFALFRNMQLWEGKYGHAKSYSRFFSIYPLSDAPYIAPYEELEVFAAFHYFLTQAEEVDLLPSARLLIAEFIRHFVSRMPFYYPRYLPEEAISEEVKTGEIDRDLWIPLEDLRDGWEKSGQVGQEVYGAAGAGFGILPRQYFRLEENLLLFIDYPVKNLRRTRIGVSLEVNGSEKLECRMRLLGKSISHPHLRITDRRSRKVLEYCSQDKDGLEFIVSGNAKISIAWK